ncbi:MAG: hypothetical protein V4722_18505 [Bacteroidota bacterium]
MTNVLFPTDFNAASLTMIGNAIKNGSEKMNIVLFHAFELPSSPFDLLTGSYKTPVVQLMNESFRQACKQLKDEYPRLINKITVTPMHGDTVALFRNFIDANDIDMICCPVDYFFKKAHKNSVDPRPLFKKSSLPVVKQLVERKIISTHRFATNEKAIV